MVYHYYSTLSTYSNDGGGLTPTATVNIYGGELANHVGNNAYGFGNSSSTLTSPGPTLNFKVGDVVRVNFYNSGTMPNSFEINTQNNPTASGAQVLFNSEINLGTWVQPGSIASITFNVTQAGNFYYLCPVPGHALLGMWGNCMINP